MDKIKQTNTDTMSFYSRFQERIQANSLYTIVHLYIVFQKTVKCFKVAVIAHSDSYSYYKRIWMGLPLAVKRPENLAVTRKKCKKKFFYSHGSYLRLVFFEISSTM